MSTTFFLALAGAVAIVWLARSPWSVLALAGAAYVGFLAGRITPLGLGALALFTGLLVLHQRHRHETVLLLVVAGAAAALYSDVVPGFNNWVWAATTRLSPQSVSYTGRLRPDKAMAGALLFWHCLILQPRRPWRAWLAASALPIAITVGLLALAGWGIRYVRLDPKLPELLVWWLPNNLLFVCVAEEALFRGLLQPELTTRLGSRWLAMVVCAVLFGLIHLPGGTLYVLLASLAGLGYGYARLRADALESAVVTHFATNLLHILLFTYPALSPAFR